MLFNPAPNEFITGAVEGFYGRPWTPEQRKNLFILLKQLGLNTYLYAPKDDVKHRACWKEMYNDEERKLLTDLIESAREAGIRFVYAISPGLDVDISARMKVKFLKEKLGQVQSFGCRSFALLFDDIYLELCAQDREEFGGSAAAVQAYIANATLSFLEKPEVFLFCPTEYCSSRASPSVLQSEYLQTLGRQLHAAIDILWTGPMVVSKYITAEHLSDLVQVLMRRPVIWDNIHANDYDQKCIYLGPYEGRSLELASHTKGVLTNPNCEFEANYIALHTMAQWVAASFQLLCAMNTEERGHDDTITGTEGGIKRYDAYAAYRTAISDWLEGPFYMLKPSPNYSVPFSKPASFIPAPASDTGPATFPSGKLSFCS